MRIRLRLPSNELRRWHHRLLLRLSQRPDWRVDVAVCPQGPVPRAADALFALETRLFGLPREALCDRIAPSALEAFALQPASPDIVLDLTSAPLEGAWRLAYDGVCGEGALIEAALQRRTPVVTLLNDSGLVAAARPGTEHVGLARSTLDDIFARLITLIAAALAGRSGGGLPALPEAQAAPARGAPLSMSRLAGLTAQRAKQRAVRGLYSLGFHSPHWRVGWRRREGGDLIDLRRHPDAGWNDLADDGLRFYADPFPLLRQGRVTLFVEEFEHRTAKGIISAVEFDEAGPKGAPRAVLEQPHHLSYPNVFERDGETWMIPESCASASVDLYRATAFPGGWTHEARLVEGVVASDATLLERDGAWWMFATVRDGGGSYCDALHLWRAPSFRGPWTPHARNPVLIDIASARPAGRLVERGGALYRPVQDCRDGYGAALGLARIDRLDDEGFSQTVETILRAGPKWRGRRIHTLNGAGAFEFIDGSALAPRLTPQGRSRPAAARMRPAAV